jgi:hypothetical protein
VAYAVTMLGMCLFGPALGHDEAVYALGADALLGGDSTPAALHRPIGTVALAVPAVLAGGDDRALRLTGLLGTLCFLTATWSFARRAVGAASAVWVVAIVATSYTVVARGTELLPDLWASALILWFATILLAGLAPDAPARRRWWSIALGPLAAGAFYIRYGSLPVTASVAVAGLIVYRRAVPRAVVPLAAAVVIAGVLAVPHVVLALAATGNPLGILERSQQMAGRGYLGDGLVFYATAWWSWLGPIAALSVAAGAVAAVRRATPFARFAGLASLLALVAIGTGAHGEPRFALIPQVLCTTAGVEALRDRIAPRARLAAALVAITFVGSVAVWTRGGANTTHGVAADAGAALRRLAAGQRCTVVAGKWAQLAWYSGCRGIPVAEVVLTPALLRDLGTTFVVWLDAGPRQPPRVLADLLAGRNGVRATAIGRIDHAGRWGGATIYRITLRSPP